MKWRIFALVAFLCLAACGDDDSDFATRPDGKESSSSDVSSSSDSPQSSDGETSVSSSSSAKSSSSSVASSSCSSGDYVEPSAVVVGSMTDERDGQTYKTVTIGTQTWMAENLNYAYTDVPYEYEKAKEVFTSDSTSWCYDNDPVNCSKYGRLYTWAAAMDSVGTWSANSKGCGQEKNCSPIYPVRGVCPEGWHLPDTTEWKTLIFSVGGFAGMKLKSTTNWHSGGGTDAYLFSALPAGERGDDGYYYGENYRANFWCSTEFDYYYACGMLMRYDINVVNLYGIYKGGGYSVRCVKD